MGLDHTYSDCLVYSLDSLTKLQITLACFQNPTSLRIYTIMMTMLKGKIQAHFHKKASTVFDI